MTKIDAQALDDSEQLDPERVVPWHDIWEPAKVATLVESMRANGWQGAPIVVMPGRDYGWGPGDPTAITGSHRIAAAREARIDVPVVWLDDLLAQHGTNLGKLDELTGSDDDHYETIVRLEYHLPDEVVDFYGLDAH